MTIGDAKVLDHLRSVLPAQGRALAQGACRACEHVFLTDCSGNLPAGHDRSGERPWRKHPDSFETVWTAPEDMALLHFTSGTTGRPKGAVHVHEAVVAHHITGRLALDLHPDDVFWCTADPGWVTGTSYGIISPLTNGATLIVDQAEFDAERWYRILQDQKVTVWYTAPTAIRMLMKVGAEHRQAVRSVEAALHGERRRAAQSRGRGVGRRGLRQCRSTTIGGRPKPAAS